jgi:hypothetical protein
MTLNKRQTDSIGQMVNEYHDLQAEIAELDSRLVQIKEEIMQTMEKHELETLVIGEENADETRVTIVRPTTLKINEAGLEKALSPAQWKLITKKVVDKKALEDAVVRGKIDPTVVADNSNEVASKPYLRITG